MAKRNRNNGFYTDRFWQSDNWNMRSFMMYRDWLRATAMNRFKWIGLPETCSERYLEFTLINEGVACICYPKNRKGEFYSTRVALASPPNVYDDYNKWISIGNNGWKFEASTKTGVIVWGNRERIPILQQIDLYARRLAWCDRIVDSNLNAQKNSIILTGDQRQQKTLENMAKMVQGGEPMIVGTDGLEQIKIEAINLGVPFVSENIQNVKSQIYNDFLTSIGVQSSPHKKERMIEDEVIGYTEPTEFMKLDSLSARREAVDILNNKFGLNIQVVWNSDYESDNFMFEHNLEEKEKLNVQTKQSNNSNNYNESKDSDKQKSKDNRPIKKGGKNE